MKLLSILFFAILLSQSLVYAQKQEGQQLTCRMLFEVDLGENHNIERHTLRRWSHELINTNTCQWTEPDFLKIHKSRKGRLLKLEYFDVNQELKIVETYDYIHDIKRMFLPQEGRLNCYSSDLRVMITKNAEGKLVARSKIPFDDYDNSIIYKEVLENVNEFDDVSCEQVLNNGMSALFKRQGYNENNESDVNANICEQ